MRLRGLRGAALLRGARDGDLVVPVLGPVDLEDVDFDADDFEDTVFVADDFPAALRSATGSGLGSAFSSQRSVSA